MDHEEATSTRAAESYVLGEMTPEERDQYEEHFFSCPECAEEVRAAAIFLENAKSVLAVNLQEGNEPNRGPWWTGKRALFWPLPLGAAAALLVLLGVVGYQSLIVLPSLKDRLREGTALQSAPWYFLSISRSELPIVTVSGQQRMVGLTLSKSSDRSFPSYLCEVRNAAGQMVISAVLPAPPAGDELQILVPTERLRPGAYVVAVAGLDPSAGSAPASAFARYHFTFDRLERGDTKR
ncbi:MAG TPA: zf-HC2 domain-containing protein [Vicinamibacteria bacterium]|jgi:hypothetical protein|nr:zf-HC2 domain-containing protein [Vicinamibacteria bacterium]